MILPDAALMTLLACSLMLLAGTRLNRRQRQVGQRRSSASLASEGLDTVNDWPPKAVRVLSISERRAIDLVKSALPGFLVLAQVPLARFLRVPGQHSQAEWLRRAGSINADLVVCDSGSRVLAVVDIRAQAETSRSRRRHERMARVLGRAGVDVLAWDEAELPSPAEARRQLTALLTAAAARRGHLATRSHGTSRPMPLIPVADIEEVLCAGDAAFDAQMEPVPSAFFEDDTPTANRQLH